MQGKPARLFQTKKSDCGERLALNKEVALRRQVSYAILFSNDSRWTRELARATLNDTWGRASYLSSPAAGTPAARGSSLIIRGGYTVARSSFLIARGGYAGRQRLISHGPRWTCERLEAHLSSPAAGIRAARGSPLIVPGGYAGRRKPARHEKRSCMPFTKMGPISTHMHQRKDTGHLPSYL